MPILTICNLKGGTGKTTTAVYLGHAFAAAHRDVKIIDADPQGSATEWADRAQEQGAQFPFLVVPGNARSIARATSQSSWVIIDCPPGTAHIIDAAITAADYVIVPTRPSAIEVDRMWDTLQISATTQPKVLLNSIIPGTRSLKALRAALREQDIPTFNPEIPQREAIKNSFGGPITKLFGYDFVANELLNQDETKE